MAFGALSSGISALRSFSQGMEVIGNNIANVNTVSFKGSRIKYSETFNQVLQQSAPSPSDGQGSNVQASQVGLGVQVEGIVGQFHQGGLSSTNQLTDLAISGEGFFKVVDTRNNNAEYATRGGDFRIDDRGYLVTSSGMRVQGMTGGSIGFEVDVNADGDWHFITNQDSQRGTISPNEVGDIQLDYLKGLAEVVDSSHLDGNVTRNSVMYTNNLVSRDATGAPVWGSLPASDPVTGVFDPASVEYGGAGEAAHRVGSFVYDDPDNPTEIVGVTGWHAFMETAVNDLIALRNKSNQGSDGGGLVTDADIQQAVASDFYYRMFASDLDAETRVSIDGNAVQRLFIDDNNLTWDTTINAQGTVDAVMSTFPADWSEAEKIINQVRQDKTPDLSRFSVDSEGRIRYFLSNGDSFERGQVMLVDFNDKTALIREGQNLYSGFGAAGLKGADENDGLQVAGRNGLGLVKQGALELSNVDLTNEFAQMITTQRGFQAGSRIITVSDDILQEVVNLKR